MARRDFSVGGDKVHVSSKEEQTDHVDTRSDIGRKLRDSGTQVDSAAHLSALVEKCQLAPGPVSVTLDAPTRGLDERNKEVVNAKQYVFDQAKVLPIQFHVFICALCLKYHVSLMELLVESHVLVEGVNSSIRLDHSELRDASRFLSPHSGRQVGVVGVGGRHCSDDDVLIHYGCRHFP